MTDTTASTTENHDRRTFEDNIYGRGFVMPNENKLYGTAALRLTNQNHRRQSGLFLALVVPSPVFATAHF